MLHLIAPLLFALAAETPAPAVGPGADDPAWGRLLEADARAMRAAIEDSHPGPVDDQNPGFRRTVEDGYRLVLKRAATARTQGGWWWALREYEAAFGDGHLSVATTEEAVSLPSRWPGFLTRFEGEDQVVVVRLDEPGLPAMGAKLVSCDGRPAAALAADIVGRFRGRWTLAAQRARHGARLFLDASNPWVKLPERCLFDEQGAKKTYALSWRSLSDAEVMSRLAGANRSYRAPVERRTLADGTVWISAGGFNGDPASEQGKALRALVDALNADQAGLRSAPRVVLDLRGNGGGSSTWGDELAAAVWGKPWLAAKALPASQVDWRVSTANLETLKAYDRMFREAPGTDPELLAWLERAIAGMGAALAEGRALWRQPDDPAAAPADAAAQPLYRGRVFVLTDAACASACLDAVDVWKAAGAVQVGRETSADTLYMEIREQPLPSGLAMLRLPMKVYRGRIRRLNEPHRPRFVFEGDMSDTAALEAWIRKLP